MASVHRHPKSKFYSAFFRDGAGKLRCVTTKQTEQKTAQEVADAFEKVFRTEDVLTHIRSTLDRLAKEIDPEAGIPTVKEFLARWMEAHGGEKAVGTARLYEFRFGQFVDHLAQTAKGELLMSSVKKSHALAFRSWMLKRTSAGTANAALRILRSAFSDAMNEGIITGNPFATKGLTERPVEKKAFTVEQYHALVAVADAEMRSIIKFAAFTGQRAGDLAQLRWGAVNFETRTISFTTQKTGKPLSIYAGDELWENILSLPRGTPTAPIHPKAYACFKKSGDKVLLLSRDFHDVMVKAGVVSERKRKQRDAEGVTSRVVSPLSLHSLRHSTATWLRKVGASESTSRDYVGHDSVAVDRQYITPDEGASRDAAIALSNYVRKSS
ncbi:MAG: tyrosine-type recombinase/integrase [bacterium]